MIIIDGALTGSGDIQYTYAEGIVTLEADYTTMMYYELHIDTQPLQVDQARVNDTPTMGDQKRNSLANWDSSTYTWNDTYITWDGYPF